MLGLMRGRQVLLTRIKCSASYFWISHKLNQNHVNKMIIKSFSLEAKKRMFLIKSSTSCLHCHREITWKIWLLNVRFNIKPYGSHLRRLRGSQNRYSYNPLTFQSSLLWVENLKVKYLQTNLEELDEAIAWGISVTIARREVTFGRKLKIVLAWNKQTNSSSQALSQIISKSEAKFHEIKLNQNLGKTYQQSASNCHGNWSANCPKLGFFWVEGFH